jgi:hypothetical protein
VKNVYEAIPLEAAHGDLSFQPNFEEITYNGSQAIND